MSKVFIPQNLRNFIEDNEYDATPYTEKIHRLYFSLMQEYFWNDPERNPFKSDNKNFVKLSTVMSDHFKKPGYIHENYLSTLCFPGKNRKSKKWTKGRDKEKLIAIYDYLVHHPAIVAKGNEDYWIDKALRDPEKIPSNDSDLVNYVLGNTNFSRVTVPEDRSKNANRFYNCFPPCLEDLTANFDFPRSICSGRNGIYDILKRHETSDQSTYILIKGVGGSGKSTLLKRISLNLAQSGKNVIVLDSDWIEDRKGASLQTQIKRLLDVITDCTIVIDGVAECIFREDINFKALAEYATDKRMLMIFCEQSTRWSLAKNKMRALTTGRGFYEFPLSRLDDAECNAVVDKMIHLERRELLSIKNESLTREKRLEICRSSANRHLVVAMLQVRHGINFSEIIIEEFRNIPSKIGQEAYLNICFWHNWHVAIPESLFIISLGLDSSLELLEFRSSTDELIFENFDGLMSRHYLVAQVLCRNFIRDKFQRFHYLKKLFSIIQTDAAAASTLFDRLLDGFPRIIATILHYDANLIREIISTINQHKTIFNKDLYVRFLIFQGMVERILNNDDAAMDIYKFIVKELNPEHAFSFRQMAWIEQERKNFEAAAKYAIASYQFSKDVPEHVIQTAQILSSTTVENFRKADFYYRAAIKQSGSQKKYKEEYNIYLKAVNAFEKLEHLNEKEILPFDIAKLLNPNLKFLKIYFGVKSKEYRDAILDKLDSIGASKEGDVGDLNSVVEGFDLEKDNLVKSKYYSNLARLMYLEWKDNPGVTDSGEIFNMFTLSIDLNFNDPFAHSWLGTYYKEINEDYELAEKEYRLAVNLSGNATHDFDKNHPIFPNNLALFIMDQVTIGKKDKKHLQEAHDLLLSAVKMNEIKGSKFTWAQQNLVKCEKLISNME